MLSKITLGLGALSLLAAATVTAASEYCTTPYLNATNIRPACEQFGAVGLHGLYQSNLHINGLLNTRVKITMPVR